MRLLNVECARGLAALSVVLFHATAGIHFLYGLDDPTGLARFGEHGVDFFFVLSGFIITYVHGVDIGVASKFQPYVLKRVIRLFPLIWIVVVPWIVLRAIGGANHDSFDTVLTSLLLVPSETEPVPLALWTLRHEVVFYAAFGLLILWKPSKWLVASWIAACLCQLALSELGRPVEGLPSFFLSSFNLQFLLGAVVGYIHTHLKFRRSVWPFVLGMTAVALALTVEGWLGLSRRGVGDYVSPIATAWVLVLGLAFAVFLHGILCLPARASSPRLFVMLGAASFAIYLVHIPAITILQRGVGHLPSQLAVVSFVVLVTGSVAVGLLLHLFVERPVATMLRSKLLRPSGVPLVHTT